MLKSALATIAVLAASVSLTSCGAASVSAEDVESQITGELKGADGSSPDAADCPDDLEAEVGATMTCTITVGEDELEVEVKVTEVEDGTAKFAIEVVE